MDLALIAAVTAIFLAYALISGKLSRTILTAPLLFAVIGFLLDLAVSASPK